MILNDQLNTHLLFKIYDFSSLQTHVSFLHIKPLVILHELEQFLIIFFSLTDCIFIRSLIWQFNPLNPFLQIQV